MSAALEASHLGKRFGRTKALEDVNLTVEAGAAVALFGPNGAGKTTFLRLCSTQLRPTQGSVRVAGLDVRKRGSEVRRQIAVLGHESFLYPDLTPAENLLFYARLYKVPDPGSRVRALVDRMGLLGFSQRPVRTLSRGMVQRCALARVLLHQPRVLFLDEPFTGLDLDARATLREVLTETHRSGATLLLSTHDFTAGFQLCSSAVVLVRGRLAWHGPITPAERGKFEANYHALTHTASAKAAGAQGFPQPPAAQPQTPNP